MHRYRVDLSARVLDESSLRDLLERQFGATDILIGRDTIVPRAQGGQHKGIHGKIFALLSDGKPHRQKQIIGALGLPRPNVARALGQMVQRGQIDRLQHGVYIVADAATPPAAEIPPPDWGVKSLEQRLLPMLTEPRSPNDLKRELRVSRQRINQMLSSLENRLVIKRIPTPGEIQRFLFVSSDVVVSNRTPILSDAKSMVISALTLGEMCAIEDVAETSGTSSQNAKAHLLSLEKRGLVQLFRFSKRTLVTLLPAGRMSPFYLSSEGRALTVNLAEEFGERRLPYLQALFTLGPLRSRDMTDALPPGARRS